MTRRDVLMRAGHGFGALALQHLARAGDSQAKVRVNPLASKPPHFPAKAKSVIFLFMVGGPSHIDTFDPKPALKKFEGQKLPESFGKVPSQFTEGRHAAAGISLEIPAVRPVGHPGLYALSKPGQMRG